MSCSVCGVFFWRQVFLLLLIDVANRHLRVWTGGGADGVAGRGALPRQARSEKNLL